MADVNYVNPGSIRPEYDYKPSGILGGMMFAQDRSRYDQMAGLQDLMMQNQAAKSQEDLIQGAPVRQAERTAALADLPMKSRGLAATTEGQELGTAFTRATQPGAIDLTNQGNRAKAGDQRLQVMEQGIAVAKALSELGPLGPDAIPRLAQMGLPMDNPIVQQILNTPDPRQIGPRAQQALRALSEARASYRTTMDQESAQQAGALVRGERAGFWAVEVAKQRSAARIQGLLQQFQTAKTTEQMQFIGEMIMQDPEIDEGIKARVRAGVEQARRSEAAKRAQGAITLPGFPAPGGAIPNFQQQLSPQGPNSPVVTKRFNPNTGQLEPVR